MKKINELHRDIAGKGRVPCPLDAIILHTASSLGRRERGVIAPGGHEPA